MFKRYILSGLILLFFITINGSPHKFYVSITQIDINKDSRKLEISARIFSEDLEAAIEAESGQKLRLGTEKVYPKADSLLFSYISSTLGIKQDGADLEMVFIGKEVETDVTWIYVESKLPVSTDKPMVIRNAFLQEKFPDQKNIVNLKFDKSTVSQIHTKGKPEFSYHIQ